MRRGLASWPAWVWAVLAWLAWAVLLEDRTVRLSPELRRRVDALVEREARAPTPETMFARRWRTVPGVGERRALALVRAAEEGRLGHDGTSWPEVEGIGIETAVCIAEWFRSRTADATARKAGAGPGPATDEARSGQRRGTRTSTAPELPATTEPASGRAAGDPATMRAAEP